MLSPSEENLIRSTWAVIQEDLKGYGAKIFLRFFSDYPKHQKAFRSFANVPYDELTKNKRFMAHAYTVISAVDGLVENIDDPEMLFEMLLKTGMNHGKRHKIESDSFDEFQKSFMGFLETSLKEKNKWTSEVEETWGTVVGLIIAKIKEGLDQDD